MIKDKRSDHAILAALQQEGVEPGYAEMILSNVKNDAADRTRFRKKLLMGLLVTAGGGWLYYHYRRMGGAPISLLAGIFWGISTLGIVMTVQAFGLYRR